jgi:hypothetical protein
MKNQKTEKTIVVTQQELTNLLLNEGKNELFKNATFAHVVYFTDESGSKTVDKKKVLQKIVHTQITIGSSYENRINKDLVKQGEEANFTSQGMSGKQYCEGSRYVAQALKDSNVKYLCYVVENHVKPATIYFHEGKRISKKDAIEKNLFMPSYFAEKKTAGRGNMSEERDFKFNSLGLDKILTLKIRGIRYKVVN